MPATEKTTHRNNPDLRRAPVSAPAADATGPATSDRRLPGASWFVLAGIVVLLSAVAAQGSDLLWGVALGDHIRAGLGIPQSAPFAAAPSGGWVNPMALGEVLLSAVHSLGPSALIGLHLVLVATTLATLLASGRTHRREGRASTALLLVAVGGASTLAVARMPSLSLLPYAALVVLLLQNTDRPSRRLWLAVPLLALWGNLHGGVLVGCALLAVHLICCPGPLPRRALVGASSFAAVLFATSAGWRTLFYYQDVLGNEAARQHVGLWARPNLGQPLDVLMLLAAGSLIGMWLRSQPRLWEVISVAGMGVATLAASRNSVWLLLFLLPLATRGRQAPSAAASKRLELVPVIAALTMSLGGVVWQMAIRAPTQSAAGTDATPLVRQLAAGRNVLAVPDAAETFAQAGIRVWASNPIDAFPRDVQREYLAFIDQGSIPARPSVGLVVVNGDLASKVSSKGWRQVGKVGDLLIFAPPGTQDDRRQLEPPMVRPQPRYRGEA